MKIELIDFGGKAPFRAHPNDAGADVYSNENVTIKPMETVAIGIGIGIKTPDGYVTKIESRSGLSSKGIKVDSGKIDSGYRGEIRAITTNQTGDDYHIHKGDRIAQLVTYPIAITDYEFGSDWKQERGANGFGSTGMR